MDYRINKWKYLGYVVGGIGILINLFFLYGDNDKKGIGYKCILLGEF